MGGLFDGKPIDVKSDGEFKIRRETPKPTQSVVSDITRTLSGLTPDQASAFIASVSAELKKKGYEYQMAEAEIKFPQGYGVRGNITYVLDQDSQSSGNVFVKLVVSLGIGANSKTQTSQDLGAIIDSCAERYLSK